MLVASLTIGCVALAGVIFSMFFFVFRHQNATVDAKVLSSKVNALEFAVKQADPATVQKLANHVHQMDAALESMDAKLKSATQRWHREKRAEEKEASKDDQTVDPSTIPGAVPLFDQGSPPPASNGSDPMNWVRESTVTHRGRR